MAGLIFLVELCYPCTNHAGSYNSTLVEARGVEPLSESTLTETSPGADGYLHSLIPARAVTLRDLVAS